MTPLQKDIIKKIFEGCNIASNPSGVFRLRDKDHSPLMKVYGSTFKKLNHILRKHKGLFVIDKTAVRKLHGKNWIKQYYKSLNKKA